MTIGSINDHRTPAATFSGPGGAQIFATKGDIGNLPGTLSENGQPTPTNLGEVLTHELGHVDAAWYYNGTDSNGDAVRIENQVRQLEGGPGRIGHNTPYDVPLSGMPY